MDSITFRTASAIFEKSHLPPTAPAADALARAPSRTSRTSPARPRQQLSSPLFSFRKNRGVLGNVAARAAEILAGLRACGEQIIRERLCRCLQGRRAQGREIIENQ